MSRTEAMFRSYTAGKIEEGLKRLEALPNPCAPVPSVAPPYAPSRLEIEMHKGMTAQCEPPCAGVVTPGDGWYPATVEETMEDYLNRRRAEDAAGKPYAPNFVLVGKPYVPGLVATVEERTEGSAENYAAAFDQGFHAGYDEGQRLGIREERDRTLALLMSIEPMAFGGPDEHSRKVADLLDAQIAVIRAAINLSE